MATVTVKYEGGVASSFEVRGHKCVVDLPKEMGGEDRGPTPIELVAGALGTCIATYIIRWCNEAHVPVDGLQVKVDFVHDVDAHCIRELSAHIELPPNFPEKRRDAVLRVADMCTVHNTLCSNPKVNITLSN